MTSTVGRVEYLVVEDGDVEGKAKADGVCGWEFGDGNVGSSLVSLEGLVGGLLSLIAGGELGEVTVAVTLHLVVEDFGFASGGGGNQVLVKNLEDILADFGELRLDLLPVALDHGDLGLEPFDSSFYSMEEMNLHKARHAPIRFLYATESKLRSSTVSSWSEEATRFMFSTISAEVIRPCQWARQVDGTNLHIAQPAQRAWRGRQSLHEFETSGRRGLVRE